MSSAQFHKRIQVGERNYSVVVRSETSMPELRWVGTISLEGSVVYESIFSAEDEAKFITHQCAYQHAGVVHLSCTDGCVAWL